ncbi:hydroxyphenylacetyl-CoA thioesterase PaaI [Cumulibacter manganitolerans]|uniref:hydroxyphenylacetyl-CoA thioesterase PaaI n=1 Tax=Cumulibacter manganitolerans TaxID=1884992 RepID=UPI001298138B|nr:hydroxyphenylacetyl-CoA thioesterase PaaI [Cumulibacter manganitolerans]
MPLEYPNQHIADLVANDRTAQWLGATLVGVGPGTADVVLGVGEQMCNGHGTCHGGVLFTLADIAFSYACNSAGVLNVAAAADVQFVAPAHAGQRLRASARERLRYGKDRRSGLYDVQVTVEDTGELVALFTGRAAQIGGRS